MPRPSPNHPRPLSPEYIDAYLANANRLAVYCFAAQGIDGHLRTAEPRHAALRYELERAAEVIAQLRAERDAARSMLADQWASYERIEKDRDHWRKAALRAGADPVTCETVGDYGTATAGDLGTAAAGDHGTATAGDHGTATAGDHGTATAGYRGTATVGDYGTATVGDYGTATVGDDGTATAGDDGTATAGDHGTATAGDHGTATAGDLGTATVGDFGTATAGYRGTATVGDYGTATVGDFGTATAGDDGTIILQWWDGSRRRYAIGYVGDGGIEPNVAYRLSATHELEVAR